MSLNFSECFTSFTKEKYNKIDLGLYLLVLFLFILMARIFNNSIFSILILCFISILLPGYLAIMSHNEAHNSKKVLPSINMLFETLKIGFKYITGLSTLYVIVFLPCILTFAFFIANLINFIANPNSSSTTISTTLQYMLFIAVFFILGIILTYKYIIPASLLFIKNLSLSDMYNFSKISAFGNAIKNDYWMYIILSILLSIIVNTVASCLSPIVSYFLGISIDAFNNTNQLQSFDALFQLLAENGNILVCSFLISTIINSFLSCLVMPNLNGQVIRNTMKRINNFS